MEEGMKEHHIIMGDERVFRVRYKYPIKGDEVEHTELLGNEREEILMMATTGYVIGDDGRVFVTHNLRPGEEEVEWTEVFGEARKQILEALNHGSQDENLPNQSLP